jgi:type IV pilus assembly protein PilQ
MVRTLSLAWVILVCGISVVFAQEKAVEVVPAVSTGEVVAEVKEKAPAPEAVFEVKMSQSGNVSLDFREADIKNVLKVLSYKSGINMIAGPEVVGLVNIQLKDVPWQRALEVILSTYGYAYEQKGSIIMVTTVENLKKRREDVKLLTDQEPLSTETFVLNFSKAADVMKSLEKMKTPKGNINANERANAVIVTDVESNLMLIREVVRKLDTVTAQVQIEARIIKVVLSKQESMGLDWAKLGQVGASIHFAPRATNFPWTSNEDHYFPPATWAMPKAIGDSTVQSDSWLTYGTISISDLSVVLDALKKRENTKSVSNPRLVTMDNQAAKIQVGDRYPVPQYTFSTQTNQLQVSGWEYIDTGVVFKVTPHVNNPSLISLEIEPEIITQNGTVTVQGTDMPILNTESVKTNVMIKNGETLIIAGLINDDKLITNYRFPVLGEIPFLGALFRHKNETMNKTELVIFLTPRIITQDAKTAAIPMTSDKMDAVVEDRI